MLRLILAFDNNETLLFGSDNIDYDSIKAMVDNEFQKKQQELDEELEKYIKEKEELEKILFGRCSFTSPRGKIRR